MVNPALNVVKLAETFEREKSVQIFDFLKEEHADKLYSWYNNEIPEDWWFTSIHNPDEEGYEGANNIRKMGGIGEAVKEQEELINIKIKESNEAFIDGKFSYVFDRTTPHAATCDCLECQFFEFLKTDLIMFLVRSITQINVNTTNEVFASRFMPGHFLSPHHDEGKGKIGFVYSLSRFWRPEWGGNLHFMRDDYKTITRIIPPLFNRLTIFDIPSRNGIPHFVSHVVPCAKNKRLSVTGWFE